MAGIVAFSIGHPLNAPSPIDVTLSGIVIEVRDEQLENAFFGIDVVQSNSILDLLLIGPAEIKDGQSQNAPSPIVLIQCGIITFSKERQPANALFPIDVTLSGIVMDVSEEQSLNAPSPIDLTLSGIVIDFRDEQFVNA